MHMLVLERVPLSEPSLGSVPGKQEGFTSGRAGTDLSRVFKACLCVAAWQALTVSLRSANLLSYGTKISLFQPHFLLVVMYSWQHRSKSVFKGSYSPDSYCDHIQERTSWLFPHKLDVVTFPGPINSVCSLTCKLVRL